MEPRQINHIQDNLRVLTEITTVNAHLISTLQAKGVLYPIDADELDTERHQGAKARKLYSILMKRIDAYEKLIEALQSCGQTGAAAVLSRSTSGESPMTDRHKNHIVKNLDKLVNCTAITATLLAHLETEGILTRWEVDELESTQNKSEKAFKFYSLIRTKTDTAYEQLIKALQEHMQTGAASILKEEEEPTQKSTDNPDKTKKSSNVAEDKMLDWQCEHIGANLNELIECTILSAPLLSSSVGKNILNVDDLCELAAEPDSNTKLLKFYELVQTKGNNAYVKLIEVLEQNGMSGAMTILQEAQ